MAHFLERFAVAALSSVVMHAGCGSSALSVDPTPSFDAGDAADARPVLDAPDARESNEAAVRDDVGTGCPDGQPLTEDCLRKCGRETEVLCCPQEDRCLSELANGCISIRRCTAVGDGTCGTQGPFGYEMKYNPEAPVAGWPCRMEGQSCKGTDFGSVFGGNWTATCENGSWSVR